MKFINLAALTLVTGLAAGSAFATDAGTPPPGGPGQDGPGHERFLKADTNGDGVINKDEWRAKGDELFNEKDTNHDSKISPEEMKAHHEAMGEKWREHRAEHRDQRGTKGTRGATATPPVPASSNH